MPGDYTWGVYVDSGECKLTGAVSTAEVDESLARSVLQEQEALEFLPLSTQTTPKSCYHSLVLELLN